MELSQTAARRFLLDYHFLLPPRTLAPRTGVLTVLERLRCVQVDPLDLVGTNPHLVLQSRITDYSPALLERHLYEHRELVETFDKERSIVPVADWAGLSSSRRAVRARYAERPNPPREVVDYVRGEIDSRAPLSSLDLEDRGTAQWSWAPTRSVRAALELMFDWGELGVCGRVGSRKFYDRLDRMLPEELLVEEADEEALLARHIERRVRSLGLAARRSGSGWIGIRKTDAATRGAILDALEEAGRVVRVDVEGLRYPLYAPTEARELLDRAGRSVRAPRVSFIAPLDNVIWDRRLVKDLFGFDYSWEVYTPAAKRRYGYYVLPVLYGDRLVARIEPRRAKDALLVKGFWVEPDFEPDERFRAEIAAALERFRIYLGVARMETVGTAATVMRKA